MVLLPQLVGHRHGRHHRGGLVPSLLGSATACSTMGSRAHSTGGGIHPEHAQRQNVRRGGILVCRHQGDGHRPVHDRGDLGRRHRSAGRPRHCRIPQHLQPWRVLTRRHDASRRPDPWRDLCFRRHGDGRRRRRRDEGRRNNLAQGDQLDDLANLRLLRRLGRPHGPRPPLHRLLGQ